MPYADIYFDGTVEKVELGRTGTGKEQLAITFAITSDDPTAPKFLTAYRFFTENAVQYTAKDLTTLGWDPNANAWDLIDLTEGGRINGAKASLTCAWETYEGKERLKIKFINKPGSVGSMKEGMTPQEAMEFQQRLRRSMGIQGVSPSSRPAARPAPAALSATQSAAVGEAFGDDDTPF